MSVIDIVFIAIIIVFAILAYRRGLSRTVMEVIAFILAVVIASLIATPFANMFYNAFIRGGIERRVENAINEINFEGKVTVDEAAQVVYDNIPDFAKDLAKGTGVNEHDIISKIKAKKFDNVQALDVVMENVVEPVVLPAVRSISFIVLSAILIFVLRLFAGMISKITEKEGFTVDKFFGGVFGIFKGVVVVYVLCAALQLIYYSNNDPASAESASGFAKMLADSKTFNFMIENNPSIEALKNIF